MITSDDVSEKLYQYLLSLEKQQLLNIMIEALDSMQSYNGRSITYCICEAAGFKPIGENKWQYPKRIPTAIKESNLNKREIEDGARH